MLFNSPSTSRQILTVTKLNRLARTVLEGEIGLVWLSAEISNFVAASSGHWYFTLKDNKAQVRAAMFKGSNRYVKQRPKEGDKVLVRASVGLYEPRGDYQLVIEHLEADGDGALKQAFEALKLKLQRDGLFDADAKRPVPQVINKIGVVTSSAGAALHDVLTVLKRRSPATEVIVYPTLVQGEQAPAQIIHALETAYHRDEVDVILLTRGGGSLEDLWCFNDEALAHCISASPVPVVSAVGHEVDVTIADFVADVRAPTPSAGAELLSRDQSERLAYVQQKASALSRAWQQQFRQQQHQLAVLQQRLKAVHPERRLQSQSQSLDRAALALSHAMESRIAGYATRLNNLLRRLDRQNPANRVVRLQDRCSQLDSALKKSVQRLLESKNRQLQGQAQLLNSVSPLQTLTRGYSITFADDKPVLSSTEVSEGDEITTRLASGEIISKVTTVKKSL
ncbi:exodeoxyribonuclease VII large subunit [Alteromonas sp. 1_MG-2023]|uniref:exodeoxyribonuclease VII large subunit n=1 Tax=Alteromonas sp. 1_MG-2023 TaxID=3062669 RepID=UPI0026E163FE|nr:exodeoxyribonuclease VII large subunit [Alteromonas sp. 1_MG-2023]MDO6474962.1 exodeoxyribonuclease VII large subunit [Alteromonas sp. 1_MG-2023]